MTLKTRAVKEEVNVQMMRKIALEVQEVQDTNKVLQKKEEESFRIQLDRTLRSIRSDAMRGWRKSCFNVDRRFLGKLIVELRKRGFEATPGVAGGPDSSWYKDDEISVEW